MSEKSFGSCHTRSDCLISNGNSTVVRIDSYAMCSRLRFNGHSKFPTPNRSHVSFAAIPAIDLCINDHENHLSVLLQMRDLTENKFDSSSV